jgi:hypothetical protein
MHKLTEYIRGMSISMSECSISNINVWISPASVIGFNTESCVNVILVCTGSMQRTPDVKAKFNITDVVNILPRTKQTNLLTTQCSSCTTIVSATIQLGKQ